MSHWIVNFFMVLMHIFSTDTHFPAFDKINAAVTTPASKRTDEMKNTLRDAHIYFLFCPGNLEALLPGLLDQIDSIFEKVFVPLIGVSGPLDTAAWRQAHRTYRSEICKILNGYIARPQSTIAPMPPRASARMCYYLSKLSGQMYIPTATALVKTVDQLLSAGLGICEVSSEI